MRSKLMGLFFLTIFLGTSPVATAFADGDFGTLRYFWTDACTNFPDGTADSPTLWQYCCVVHDLAYWAGGTVAQKFDADNALFKCVSETGEPAVAAVIYAGVTVGGFPYIPDFWRWGYGWPKVRGFTALSEEERQQVIALTPTDLSQVPVTKKAPYH